MKYCINKRCHRELEDDFKFCPWCGKNQAPVKKRETKRPNGTGSIYCRKDNKSKPWAAACSVNGKQVYLGSYATRTEAVRAITEYENNPVSSPNITLEQLHSEWKATAYKNIGDSLKSNYNTSWDKLKPLYKRKFKDIRTAEWQSIIDFYEAPHHKRGVNGELMYKLPNGKGTYKVTDEIYMCEGLKFSALHKIKVLLTSMYKYAIQNDIVNKDYASFIVLPKENEVERTRFSDIQLETVKRNLNSVPFADYIYALCYLNFRVSEFLELTKNDYFISDTGIPVFIGGKKTTAGTDRLVPIHPNIQGIVKKCLAKNGQTIFCDENGNAMSKDKFRERYFYPALEKMGLPKNLTPHSCRRTFSTRMSAAGARPEDIIALMGHTNFDVDIKHYINQEAETLYNSIKLMA